MSSLTITRGLPASGKSTFAKTWVAMAPEDRRRVNRDDMRAMLFNKPDYGPKQEAQVTRAVRAMVKELLRSGCDVIADDTNIRPKYVREWARFAKANKADFDVMEFPYDAKECIRRDALRGADKVGADVINGMSKYLRDGKLLPWEIDEPDHTPDLYEPDPTLPPAIIVDIDGTVALMNGRGPYDLSRVSEDLPNQPVIDAVEAMLDSYYEVIFCSGREDVAREDTVLWIKRYMRLHPAHLYMRAADDKRKDSIVKREIFDRHIRDRFNVRLVFDDRNQVVEMWRALGLTVCQVADGDF